MKKFRSPFRYERRFAKFANKFIYFWLRRRRKKDTKKRDEQFLFLRAFSHFSLFSPSLPIFHPILLLFFTPFIRQSIVDDDGDDDVATLPSLFRNSWTSTFIRWSKFTACILLWLKFADFYAVLKCILMLHVGRMARSTKRSSKKISRISFSLFLFERIYFRNFHSYFVVRFISRY